MKTQQPTRLLVFVNGTIVLPGARIGEHVVIGAGSAGLVSAYIAAAVNRLA